MKTWSLLPFSRSPPPPAPDSRGFWRNKADWSLDSDKDGIFDFEDIAKNDKLVAFEKAKLPRYAMFDFDDGGFRILTDNF